jgi:preprotein translocase subunit Sec63
MNSPITREQCLRVLGLPANATSQDIKTTYRDLVKVWHPDRFSHDPAMTKKADEKLKEINAAYNALLKMPETAFGRPTTYSRSQANARPKSSKKPVYLDRPVTSLFVLLLGLFILGLVSHFFFSAFYVARPAKSSSILG